MRDGELGIRDGVQRNKSLAIVVETPNPNEARAASERMNFFMAEFLEARGNRGRTWAAYVCGSILWE